MIINKYDNKEFFNKYKKMNRSIYGLEGAGEWKTFKKMLPDLEGKKILDLGCGFGWHCKYAIENKAKEVIEPMPPKEMLDEIDGMKDELRRPMMLLISAKKVNY